MIVDVQTGIQIDVCFQELKKTDINKYGLTRRNGWFAWINEIFDENNRVFGMFTLGNTDKDIQGVISIQERELDQYVFVSLMESSPHNQYNHPHRRYAGVGINLLCFAMHHSF